MGAMDASQPIAQTSKHKHARVNDKHVSMPEPYRDVGGNPRPPGRYGPGEHANGGHATNNALSMTERAGAP
eukprot:9784664-Lingulodinium_polyedra.AAC.1